MVSILTSENVNSLINHSDLAIEEQVVMKLECGSARVVSNNGLFQPGILY